MNESAQHIVTTDVLECRGSEGGLPLVLAPQGADQFTNAAACQRAGVARVLSPGALSSTAVRYAVLAILRPGSTERDRARCVAGEIASMPIAAEVAQQIEVLVGS